MMLGGKLCYISALLTAVTAMLGDLLESRQRTHWLVAVTDNLTHFLVGCCTWFSVAASRGSIRNETIYETVLCGLIASLIDVDHFITAGSFRLSDATTLKHRPFLHCTSLILLVASSLILIGNQTNLSWLWNLGWLTAAAGISHHVRDAARRGLWLWPFGSTPPLPYFTYIIILIVFPLCLPHLQRRSEPITSPKIAQELFTV